MDHQATHHRHQRKRIHQKEEEFPHPNKGVRLLDRLCTGIAFVAPLTAVPQIIEIYVYRNAAGVSLLTWALFFLFNLPFLVYGFVHKEKPIWIMYSLWLVVYVIVITGTLMYG